VASFVVFILLLATSVWVGGFVAIAIVARVARRELDEPTRTAFFRGLGRRYLRIGGGSLAVAFGCGGILLAPGGLTAAKTVAVALGVALAIATVAGVVQARAMTLLRQRSVHDRDDTALAAAVRSAAVRAALLRASIGALTVALLVVASVIAT
jgi:uncharacterized membrane protein